MAAAVDLRIKPDPGVLLADVQGADALGAVHLVTAEAQQVDAHFLDVDRNLADGLHGVSVEEDALFLAKFADGLDRQQRADFVVGGHDRDKDRLVGHRFADLLGRDLAELVHGQVGDLEAVFFEALAGVERRLVLGHLGDDVITLLLVHVGDALEGKVDRLGRAGGEDDFGRAGADQVADLLPGLADGVIRLPPERVVPARGVPELLREVGNHRVHHPRIRPGRGIVVHVNRQFHHDKNRLRDGDFRPSFLQEWACNSTGSGPAGRAETSSSRQ